MKKSVGFPHFLTLLILCLSPSGYAAMGDNSNANQSHEWSNPRTSLIAAGSGTLGPQSGLGLSLGLNRMKCQEMSQCRGYGLLLHSRLREQPIVSLEAIRTAVFFIFPAYAGLGVRSQDGRVSGAQLSLGVGLPFLMGTLSAYTDPSNLSFEFSVSIFGPILGFK